MIEFLGWLMVVGLLISGGVILGVLLTDRLDQYRRKVLDAREAKLQQEWQALQAAQRLNAAFMEARRAMWEEAVHRHHRRPGGS